MMIDIKIMPIVSNLFITIYGCVDSTPTIRRCFFLNVPNFPKHYSA